MEEVNRPSAVKTSKKSENLLMEITEGNFYQDACGLDAGIYGYIAATTRLKFPWEKYGHLYFGLLVQWVRIIKYQMSFYVYSDGCYLFCEVSEMWGFL